MARMCTIKLMAAGAVLLLPVLLAGCAIPGAMGPQPSLRSPADLASAQSLAAPDADFPDDRWWQRYNDRSLDALIEEGLAQSPDIAMARARLDRANALNRAARAARLPHVALGSGITGHKYSRNQTFPPQFIPDDVKIEGTLNAELSIDPDLWGGRRAALAAATSDARAAQVDMAQARIALTTAIARSYFALGRLAAEEQVARDAERIARDTLGLTQQRAARGLDNDGAVQIALARVAQAQGELAGIEDAARMTRHALAALVGAGPDRGLTITPPPLGTGQALALPANLPLNLVGRRPDLVASRLRAQAALSRVGVARAAYYPDINLFAVGGLNAIGLDRLTDSESLYANFGRAVRIPLFQGGAISAQYKAARAEYDAAVADYDATLVAAIRDVADLVARKSLLVQRIALARDADAAGREAHRIMALRHGQGIASQLDLLMAEDATIAAHRALVLLRALDVETDIALVQALGGGYAADASPSPPSKGRP